MTEIVKVAMPFRALTLDPDQRELAVVSAEGRRCMVQQRIDPDTRAAMGDDVEAFFEADYRRSAWKIGKRVVDRRW